MSIQSRGRKTVAWILTGLVTIMFVGSAVIKIAGAQSVVEMFNKWGLQNHLLLIGIGELVSAVLFLIPRTNSLGLLLLSAYLGGAIVTHMQHGEPYIIPAALLLVVWLTGYLRHPEALHSFRAAQA